MYYESCRRSLRKANFDTHKNVMFLKNETSLSRDTYTSGEQDDLHERGRVHGTSINSHRGEESGAGYLSAHNRDLLHIPQGKPSAFDCRSRAARDFLGNNFQ